MGLMRPNRAAYSGERTAIDGSRSRRFRVHRVIAAITASFCLGFAAHGQSGDAVYDTVVRNGRVIDGTGNPAVHADVAIKDGKIAAIGRIAGAGKSEVDARGLVVAPGFIDVHSHAE